MEYCPACSPVPIFRLRLGPGEEFLEPELEGGEGSFVGAGPLVYLKLKASRLRDQADVLELIKSSLDIDACRRYLRANAPDLLPRFDELVARAETE